MSTQPNLNFLLVEDDTFKQDLLEQFIRSLEPKSTIHVGRSVQQAVALVRESEYRLIILDMALPSHTVSAGGAQPMSQPSGGIEVLLELSFEARADRVAIVTQYPEIEFDGNLYPLAKFKNALDRVLAVNVVAVIYFESSDDAWRKKLKEAAQ